VAARVHGHDPVPVLDGRPLQPESARDADVEHDPVEATEARLRLAEHPHDVALVGGVGCDRDRISVLRSHQLGGRLGTRPIDVGDGDRRSLAREEHRHRPSVADRRVVDAVVLLAAADYEDPSPGQSLRAHGATL
jgi:hypothetical protein